VNTGFHLYHDPGKPDLKPPQLSHEDIPALPGLYAWYLDFANPQQPVDIDRFLEQYRRYLNLISGDNNVTDQGRKIATLRSSEGFDVYHADLYRRSSSREPDSPNDVAENHEGGQEILRCLLSENFVSYLNPIYIGISDNLQTRYAQHHTAFTAAKRNVECELSVEDRYFGSRLASAGFEFTEVVFGCIAINHESLNMELKEAVSWIKRAEHLFNFITHPIFGRT
jgi:hypothetical protein